MPPSRRVLELGCGDCRELAAYSMAFNAVSVVNVDLDLPVLRNVRLSLPNATLIQANITQLPFHARFDLIVARHPNVDQRPRDWRCVLQHTPNWLAEWGILLVTTYSVAEHERISGWLSSCDLTRLVVESARLSPPGLSGRDRFVLAYRSYNN
jgi:SAM-dependent methyltransferase